MRPASSAQQRRLSGTVRAGDEQSRLRLDPQVERGEAARNREAGRLHEQPGLVAERLRSARDAGEGERRRGLAHLLALENAQPPLGVVHAPCDGLVVASALEAVDELVVVARPTTMSDGARRDRHGMPQAAELLLFVGVLALPAVAFRRLVLEVLAEAASEHCDGCRRRVRVGVRCACGVEIDQSGGDGVEEGAVVAGEQHGSGPVAQLSLEELGGGVVEVVGRLVEEQGVGPPQQQCRERDAAALTAGDLVEASIELRGRRRRGRRAARRDGHPLPRCRPARRRRGRRRSARAQPATPGRGRGRMPHRRVPARSRGPRRGRPRTRPRRCRSDGTAPPATGCPCAAAA